MNSFWKTLDEKMQDLYSRMGWGTYPYSCSAYNTAVDINRVLEAEQQFVDSINDYVYDGTL
jgi:hypothetical protein